MSREYDNYIEQHRAAVLMGFEWIVSNLPGVIKCDEALLREQMRMHDTSKYNPAEYDAYDKYFYGNNKSYQVVEDFNKAWLIHLHNNPSHWQYWILHNDDPEEGMKILDMPYNYILEMLCDWWSFSWIKGNLHEVFDWYEERKDYIKLSDRTRIEVEYILDLIKKKLSELDE